MQITKPRPGLFISLIFNRAAETASEIESGLRLTPIRVKIMPVPTKMCKNPTLGSEF